MNLSQLPSDEIREMLRDSLRGFLEDHWNASTATKQAAAPEEISAIWTRLVGQGVASLGCDFSEGGLREILVVMAELGRAACPAPMWSAALANLGLSGCRASSKSRRAARSFSSRWREVRWRFLNWVSPASTSSRPGPWAPRGFTKFD